MDTSFDKPGKPLPDHADKKFKGEIFDVWQWEQELYDGSFRTFERLERADSAHTVGIYPNGNILLTRDEQPHRNPVITPAGGQVDPGETPEEAAKREFLEETGYEIGELIPWYTHTPSEKIDWTVHAFVGRNLVKKGEAAHEAGERIEVLEYTFDDFLLLGDEPEFRDLVIRIMLLEAQLDSEKKKGLHELFYG